MDSQNDINESARLLRTMRVIECVSESILPVSVAQLSQRTDIPKATLARIIGPLISSGYLALLPGGKSLVPGPKSAQMALRILGNGQFRRECQNVLREAVHHLGETCNLTARDGDCVMYIERIETIEPLRMHLEPGTRAPLHCTAGGKMFLSQMGRDELERFMSTLTLKKCTNATIISPKELSLELARLNKLGIGLDNEEFIAGMVGVAVPIRIKRSEQPVAALVCHAASARLPLIELQKKIPVLEAYAKKIEGFLGSRPAT